MRPRRLTGSEAKRVRHDPGVTLAVQERDNAAHYWSGRIAELELQRDQELARLDADIEAAQTEAADRMLREQDVDDPPEDFSPSYRSPVVDEDDRWRRRKRS